MMVCQDRLGTWHVTFQAENSTKPDGVCVSSHCTGPCVRRHGDRLAASADAGKKTALFEPFIYKKDHFTKTGSGRT
jgi:hypothetical protein